MRRIKQGILECSCEDIRGPERGRGGSQVGSADVGRAGCVGARTPFTLSLIMSLVPIRAALSNSLLARSCLRVRVSCCCCFVANLRSTHSINIYSFGLQVARHPFKTLWGEILVELIRTEWHAQRLSLFMNALFLHAQSSLHAFFLHALALLSSACSRSS